MYSHTEAKLMRIKILIIKSLSLLSALTLLNLASATVTHRFVEDFSSIEYCDTANSNAWWDTTSGVIKLHSFYITLAGGYDTPGQAYDVAVQGNYAYVADYTNGLHVVDVTDPENPTSAGSVGFSGGANNIAVDGNYAYLSATFAGLQVVNITDPANPVHVGNYDTPGNAYAVAVLGNLAFIADDTYGLQIIDISDPASPSLIGTYDTPGNANGLAVDGDYVFVADAFTGLLIINISNPALPVLLGIYDTPGYAAGVSVAGDIAYVGDGYPGLIIVDISNPASPTLLGSIDTPQYVHEVVVMGDYVYTADNDSGMVVIDVQDPTAPIIINAIGLTGLTRGIDAAGEYAFAACGTAGLHVVDIADMSPEHWAYSSLISGSEWALGEPKCIEISGKYAYIGDDDLGLRVIDISDPFDPHEVAIIAGVDSCNSIDIRGNYAYTACYWSGFFVIDITNPAAAFIAGSCDTIDRLRAVEAIGDYAFVGGGQGTGLYVLDVSDPAAPAPVAQYSVGGSYSVYDIDIEADHAYISSSEGLEALDITDPASPTQVGVCGYPCGVNPLEVHGDYAYGLSDGFSIIDVKDPTNPTYVRGISLPDYPQSFSVTGDYAYITRKSPSDNYELWFYDISDPDSLISIQFRSMDSFPGDLEVSGDFAYVTTKNGLRVLQVFSRQFNQDSLQAQSTIVESVQDLILCARTITTQNDSIRWYVAADTTLVDRFEVVPANNGWHRLADTGRVVKWKTYHVYYGHGVNPSCSQLAVEWLYDFAVIDSIVDVPNDQGGWARIYFTLSAHDLPDEPEYPVTQYGVYRRIDDVLLVQNMMKDGMATLSTGPTGSGKFSLHSLSAFERVLDYEGRRYFVSSAAAASGTPPGVWEVIGTVPAHQEDLYIYLAPTLADSSAALQHTVYCISAETTTPTVYYFSYPDSGYSVDNIAPGVPQGFSVAYNTGSGNQLNWDGSSDADFQYFKVYRGTDPEFVLAPGDLVHATAGTEWLDTVEEGWRYVYKITAVDDAENESGPASPSQVTGAGAPPIPQAFALYQNAPNPFNPETIIRYDVPEGGGKVTVRIYDVSGRLVLTLVDRMESAGQKSARWNGANQNGMHVASGIYFYRLEAPGYARTLKMVLLQ
jgi:hypothetical protein